MSMETRYPDAPRPDTIEAGDTFEDYVCDRLAEECGIILRTYKSKSRQLSVGENKAGFEIKLDKTHTKWGHLSIEIAERSRAGGPWYLSGIFRNDNSWLYIQGNKEVFWVLFKPALIEYAAKKKVTPEFALDWNKETLSVLPPYSVDESFGTIRKFYLEYEDADRLGKRISVASNDET